MGFVFNFFMLKCIQLSFFVSEKKLSTHYIELIEVQKRPIILSFEWNNIKIQKNHDFTCEISTFCTLTFLMIFHMMPCIQKWVIRTCPVRHQIDTVFSTYTIEYIVYVHIFYTVFIIQHLLTWDLNSHPFVL